MPAPKDGCDANAFIELAIACEQINRFAALLRNEKGFSAVTTGADLRIYQGQWMFEKFVEAKLNQKSGETAVWWLDVSRPAVGWRIHTNTSISYGDYDEDVATVTVLFDNHLREKMEDCVSALIATYAKAAMFRREIERILGS